MCARRRRQACGGGWERGGSGSASLLPRSSRCTSFRVFLPCFLSLALALALVVVVFRLFLCSVLCLLSSHGNGGDPTSRRVLSLHANHTRLFATRLQRLLAYSAEPISSHPGDQHPSGVRRPLPFLSFSFSFSFSISFFFSFSFSFSFSLSLSFRLSLLFLSHSFERNVYCINYMLESVLTVYCICLLCRLMRTRHVKEDRNRTAIEGKRRWCGRKSSR